MTLCTCLRTAEKVGDLVPISITPHALIALAVSAVTPCTPLSGSSAPCHHSTGCHTLRCNPPLGHYTHAPFLVSKSLTQSVTVHPAQKVAPSLLWRCTTFPHCVAVSVVTLCSSLVMSTVTLCSSVVVIQHHSHVTKRYSEPPGGLTLARIFVLSPSQVNLA